jgi:imidazolonepropionase-like amidohydrolase
MIEKRFAITGGTLIDGTGKDPLENAVVLVEGQQIGNVGRADRVKIPAGFEKIDASELTVMPGLIDAHIHISGLISGNPLDWVVESGFTQILRAVRQVGSVLDAGVTTVRSAGSRYDIYLKRAIEAGTIVGPTIMAAGLGISRTGGHPDLRQDLLYIIPEELIRENHPRCMICDGVEEIRKGVRKLINHGVDHIKIWLSGGGAWEKDRCGDVHFTKQEMETLVNEARMLRFRVMAHVENLRATKLAIESGVDTIEHADDWEGNTALDEEACSSIVKKNIILIPTIGCGIRSVEQSGAKTLPKNILDGYKLAIEMGVKFAAGSDTVFEIAAPYGKYSVEEIERMVSVLGFSPMEAIVAATKMGAEASGITDKVGTIEKGKLADILLVEGNPLENVGILVERKNIKSIIKGGKVVR